MARGRIALQAPVRRGIALAVGGLCWLLAAGLTGPPAAAAPALPSAVTAVQPHRGANVSLLWTLPGSGITNVDQHLWVGRRAGHSSWIQNWTWRNATFGGVLGFQTDGARFNRTTGDTAIFTLQNATAASGAACGQVTGDAPGYSCRLPLTLRTDRYYRLRVSRQATPAKGQWWGAWIKDEKTGTDYLIGKIKVRPMYTELGTVRNRGDYLGAAVGCDAVPRSIAYWTKPTANLRGGNVYQYSGTYRRSTRGICTGGSAAGYNFGWSTGAKSTLGGPR